jgi:thioredoxin-dependent peroxiredoxin
MVGIGEEAPDFEGPIAGGGTIKLSSLRGSPVIVYFYPEADTPGCTTESKGFRDEYPSLQKRKVQVIGVSVDDVPKQEAFQGKYQLPFPLVADASKEIARRYGVLGPSGRARRVTFFVDAQGKITDIVDDRSAELHTKKARQLFPSS